MQFINSIEAYPMGGSRSNLLEHDEKNITIEIKKYTVFL